MTTFKSLSALALGIGLLATTGCIGTDDDFDGTIAFSDLETLGGGSPDGSGGTNGAQVAAYHVNVPLLLLAMSVEAEDPYNGDQVNPALENTGLLNTAGGRQMFGYAVRCAFPRGKALKSSAGDEYKGEEILRSALDWPARSLDTSQQEDVLGCMLAHLNPYGIHVPIFLSGPSVTPDAEGDLLGFTFHEAIWQVDLNGGRPIYNVWPLVDLSSTCGASTDPSVLTRICDQPLGNCGTTLRYDFTNACKGSNGTFVCDGKPAIMTRLEEKNVSLLHHCKPD
jgi:hypothetical protein